jgi:hypothetical protein
MEDLTSYITEVNNIQHQAKQLTSICLSFNVLFVEEAIRLDCHDQIMLLRELSSSISQQMNEVKRTENASSYGESKANMTMSLFQFAAGGILKMTSSSKPLQALADDLLTKPLYEKRPFGNVLVRVGPKGVPDDVGVISVSRLARESHRNEAQVIEEMRSQGYLLLTEEAFSLLITNLMGGIEKGDMALPVVGNKLAELTTPSLSEWRAVKISR